MTAASWHGKQAMLGPSQSQTGEGEAELVLDVPTGGEASDRKARTEADRRGTAGSTHGQDGLSCAAEYGVSHVLCPPRQPPPTTLVHPEKQRPSLTQRESPSPISLAWDPAGTWTDWGMESLRRYCYPAQWYTIINQDRELPIIPPPPTEASGGGPKMTCSPTTAVLFLRKSASIWPSLLVVPSSLGQF